MNTLQVTGAVGGVMSAFVAVAIWRFRRANRPSFAEEFRHSAGLDHVPMRVLREIVQEMGAAIDIRRHEAQALLGGLIPGLSEFEYYVYMLRFVEERTRTETARVLFCSVHAIQKVEKSIQAKRV